MRVTHLRVAVLLSIVLLLSGCSKKENRVVAKVGDRTITVEKLQKLIGAKKFSSTEEELDQKRQMLEKMIDSELMIIGALKAGLDKETDFLTQIKGVERNILLQELYSVEILDKCQPSEKEMRAYYDRMGWEVKARHILVETEKDAQEIVKQLSEGADFAELAKEKSTDKATKDKGGDLGYFTWGRMVSPFQDTVFAMQVGNISKPVETKFGWHIIKLEDRRKTQQKEYQEEKSQIKRRLLNEKTKERSDEYLTDLREKANIQFEPEAVQVVLNHFLAGKQDQQDFTEEQKEMKLVTFRGGSWDVDSFLFELSTVPSMYRPRVQDQDELQNLVKNTLTGVLLEKQARKKGLDRKKVVREKLRADRERLLLQLFGKGGIPADTTVTDEEIEAYYQDHIDDYTVFEQVKVQEIQSKSEEEAKEILKQLRAGADFAQLAREKSTRSWAAAKGGDMGFMDKRQYPNISAAALKLNVGQLGGPIEDGNKYSVIKVLAKEPSQLKPLETVKKSIIMVLRGKLQNEATKAWLEQMRQKEGVKIFNEVLESTVGTPQKEAT